jgi:hypothetical protein
MFKAKSDHAGCKSLLNAITKNREDIYIAITLIYEGALIRDNYFINIDSDGYRFMRGLF